MIEIVLKLMDVLIYIQIKSVVQFRDLLHGLHAERGTTTSIKELTLAQELVSMDQDPLFLVFSYLWKPYNNIYWVRLIKTLEGYGAAPKLQEILAKFW